MAVGMKFVIIKEGIDLSIGAILSCSSAGAAGLFVHACRSRPARSRAAVHRLGRGQRFRDRVEFVAINP